MRTFLRRPAWLTKYTSSLMIQMSVYSATMSYVTLLRHYTFRTYADLFIFSQALFSALHGKLFYETVDLGVIPSGSFLGTHFSPLMFLLLPIYALYPGPEILLVLQTTVVALGAIPVYLTSQHVLGKGWLSLAFAGIYLANPAIQALNLYDFHLESFLPFFLGMLYYYLLKRQWKGYLLFLVLSFITIDFAPLIVVAICAAVLLSNRGDLKTLLLHPRKLIGKEYVSSSIPLFTIPLALTVFYALLVASTWVAGVTVSPREVLTGFLPPPGQGIEAEYSLKLLFWFVLLGVLLFLPVLVPTRFLMVLPWFAVTIFVQAGKRTFYLIGYQYAGAFVAPYLILASIHALRTLSQRETTKKILIAIFVLSFLISPLNPLTQGQFNGIAYEAGLPIPTSHDATLYRVISLIPSNASILAEVDLISHFGIRENAFAYLPNNTTSTQFILGDQTSAWYVYRPFNFESVGERISQALSSENYGLVAYVDGILLLEQNYSGPVVLLGQNQHVFNYQRLFLSSGSEVSDSSSRSGVVFLHMPTDSNGGTFWFGPYASMIPGRYTASFYLKVSSITTGSLILDVSDFVNASYSENLASLGITPASFSSPGVWQSFNLNFTWSRPASAVGSTEFKGLEITGGPFYFDYVIVTYDGPP